MSTHTAHDTVVIHPLPPVHPHALKVACSSCNLRELCLPLGLSPVGVDRLDKLVARLCEQGTVDCHDLREVEPAPLDPRMANRLLG